MLASQRAYADAIRWIRSARRRRIHPAAFARGAFTGSFVAGLVLLGVIGLLAPAGFGAPARRTLASGWPAFVLGGLVIACLIYLVARRRLLVWLAARIADPFRRPLTEDASFEGAANALAACARPFQVRFAAGWVWGPAALAVLALAFAFSSGYFVVDAVLAGFRIGWAQPVYGVAFAFLSLAVFRFAAPRLVTWRLAASAYRSATGRYQS